MLDRMTTKALLNALGGPNEQSIKNHVSKNSTNLLLALLRLRDFRPTTVTMMTEYLYSWAEDGGPIDPACTITVLIARYNKAPHMTSIKNTGYCRGYLLRERTHDLVIPNCGCSVPVVGVEALGGVASWLAGVDGTPGERAASPGGA